MVLMSQLTTDYCWIIYPWSSSENDISISSGFEGFPPVQQYKSDWPAQKKVLKRVDPVLGW